MSMITADPKDVPHVEHFAFTPENMEKARALMANYPPGRQASAVIGLLDLAQRQQGWLPRAAMDEVARILEMAPIRVYEIATFYTMFHLRPKGKHLLQVCTTTPCWLRGSEVVMKVCEQAADGETFSVQEVECLGGCVNAPVVQINDDFYEDLDYDKTVALIEALKAGKQTVPGPQNGRTNSEALSGATTLLGMNDHFSPVGKPAPPRPRSPDFLISSTMASCPLSSSALVPSHAPRARAAGRRQSWKP